MPRMISSDGSWSTSFVPRRPGQDFTREVVEGRPESAGDEDDVRTIDRA